MRNRLLLIIVINFCFMASYAQCDDLLQAAQLYKNKGEYGKAVERYNQLEKQCPKYFNETIRGERNFCQQKMNKKPLVNHFASEESTKFGLVVSDTQLFFEAEGGTDSHISVTCEADYWLSNSGDDWLETEAIGGVLVVKCKPNPDPWKREGHVDILCGGGMSGVSKISVEQEARKTGSKTNTAGQTVSQSITVKITFEKGKTAPVVKNAGSLIKALEENESLGLQIEVPWCKSHSELKNFFGTPLIDKRIERITDYFVTSGIKKDRISSQISVIVNGEGGAECDCAYAKMVVLSDEKQK